MAKRICILLLLVLACGCGEQPPPADKAEWDSHNNRMYVRNFDGHRFIIVDSCSEGGASVVHHPDCPCNQEH